MNVVRIPVCVDPTVPVRTPQEVTAVNARGTSDQTSRALCVLVSDAASVYPLLKYSQVLLQGMVKFSKIPG